MNRTYGIAALLVAAFGVSSANAVLINEFEPNPAGGDPATQDVELKGTPNAAFDLWILSIENDGLNGLVDRVSNVSGAFDANGLAVVTINDLENPSNTLILTDSFSGSTSTDIDPADDGTLDLSTLGNILDAVGVSDSASDDSTMYGSVLGGTDILYNGEFEPLFVFRDSVTDDWYQGVTADFGGANQRLAIFSAAVGPELSAGDFSPAAGGPTFGSTNPTLIPEPASLALIGLGGLAMIRRR